MHNTRLFNRSLICRTREIYLRLNPELLYGDERTGEAVDHQQPVPAGQVLQNLAPGPGKVLPSEPANRLSLLGFNFKEC